MERRRSRRIRPTNDLHARVKATVPARIVDLSVAGAQIEVDCILRPSAECDIWIPGPEGQPVRVRAEVRRCRAVGTRELPGGEKAVLYRAGLEFMDTRKEAREAVEAQIAAAIPPDDSGWHPAPRRRGRIRIRLNSEDIHRRLESHEEPGERH